MAYKNSEDQKNASRKHYLANKEKYLSRNRLYRKSIQRFVRDLKESKPCADCKKAFPYYVMDFDHLEGKSAGVNYLMSTGRIGALKKRN